VIFKKVSCNRLVGQEGGKAVQLENRVRNYSFNSGELNTLGRCKGEVPLLIGEGESSNRGKKKVSVANRVKPSGLRGPLMRRLNLVIG